MLEALTLGVQTVFTPTNLLLIFGGTALGIFVGAMPGLSSSVGLAIVLPFTFVLEPAPALLMMIALYMAAQYGGSITAIVVGVPGTPPAMATTFDGYPLAQKGDAGKALGVSVVSSAIGGAVGTVILIVALEPVARVAIAFGPVEYFALGLFGLSIVANLVSDSMLKGFVSAVLGLLLFVVGVDVLSGYPRLTFGATALLDGIPLVPVLIGFFAVAEVLRLAAQSIAETRSTRAVSGELPTRAELRRLWPSLLRGSAIGSVIGAIPGAGATIASMIAWNEEKRFSKRPETLGTGALEGVCAPEAANNASVGAAMIPLLTLGIPGSASTAVLLGGLMLHGVRPGPLLVAEHRGLVYAIYIGFFVATLAMLAIGLLGIPLWVKIIRLRNGVLAPLILGISIVGSYALANRVFDVGLAMAFGVVGFAMTRFGFPLVPAILGLVLGPMIEANYRRALAMSGGDHLTFLGSPVAVLLLALTLASFATPLARRLLAAERINGS